MNANEQKMLDRITKLEKELKEAKKGDHLTEGVIADNHRPMVKAFREFSRIQLRIRGYSKSQATRLVNKLGDGKILEMIKKYGPMLLKIFLMLLPLFMQEPPEGQPLEDFNDVTELNTDLMESVPDTTL